MTPHPQLEWIITEEQLSEFEHDPLMPLTLGNAVRSRPYTPTTEREKVPDNHCPRHTYCRVNNGNPDAIMHFCNGETLEKHDFRERKKVLDTLTELRAVPFP